MVVVALRIIVTKLHTRTTNKLLGYHPIAPKICVDIDEVLSLAMNVFLRCKKRQLDALQKFTFKKKVAQEKLEEEARAAENVSWGCRSDDFADFDDLLSAADTCMSQLNDHNDSEPKINAINTLRTQLGEEMAAFFTSSQTCMVRRAVQLSMEAQTAKKLKQAEEGREERDNGKQILPIDERPVGSEIIFSVSEKTTGISRTLAKSEGSTTGGGGGHRKRTTIFGWPMEKRDDALSAAGAVRIVRPGSGAVINTSFEGFNRHETSASVGAPIHDLVRGTAREFHSSLLFETFRHMNLRSRLLGAVPHRRACAAYLDECARLGISPKPILDHFTPMVEKNKGEEDNQESDERCTCGNIFMTFSVFCRRCGTKRPNFSGGKDSEPPPIVCANSLAKCQCGHVHQGDARYCVKCGFKRLMGEPTHERCSCLNYYLFDSKFCRMCGRKRPPVGNAGASREEEKKEKVVQSIDDFANNNGATTHTQCRCGNIFRADSKYCRSCGTKRPPKRWPQAIEERLICVEIPGMGIGERVGIALGRCLSVLDLLLYDLDLSDNCLQDESLYEILRALERHTQVVALNLSNNVFRARASGELVKLMTPENPSIDDANEDAHADHAHLNENLQELKLNNCRLSSRTLQAIMNHISEHHVPKLHTIHLARNDMSFCKDSLGRMVKANLANLTDLDISWGGVGGQEALEMAHALGRNKAIMKLNLSVNNFGGIEQMDALNESLRNNQTLTDLDLSHNQVVEASACVAAHGLIAGANAIKHINLSGNPIGQAGSREIICEVIGNPKSRDVRMDDCSLGTGSTAGTGNADEEGVLIKDFPSFNKEFPDGPYELDLSYPPARLVALIVMKYAPLQQAIVGRLCMKNVTLNPNSPGEAAFRSDGTADRPYAIPIAKLVAGGDGEDDYLEECEGELPKKGLLKFKYEMQKKMENRILSDSSYSNLVDLLDHAAHEKQDHRMVNTVIMAVAMEFAFTSAQARQLVDFGEGLKFHIEAIALFLSKIIDKENVEHLMSKLNAIQQRQAELTLGDYYYFNPLNTTGHYRLHLNKKWDRLLLVELAAVNRREGRICRREKRPDLSQYSNYEFLRNVTLTSSVEEEDEETGAKQMVTRTEPLVYTSDWEIPSKGIFECDYVSPIRPPDDAEPAEEDMFNEFIRDCVDIKMVESDITDADLRHLFNTIDADGGGTLDATELKAVFILLGHSLTTDEVKDLISQVDDGGGSDDDDEEADGEVDFSEFRDLWNLFNHEIALRERLSSIRNHSVKFYVEAEQLVKILSYFHTAKERVEIYVIFYSRLLDEENMHEALALMGGTLAEPPEQPLGGAKIQRAYKTRRAAWEAQKREWEQLRRLELDELKRRLGSLCMVNPWHPDGQYLLRLSEYDQRLVARIIIKIAVNEGHTRVLKDMYYGAKNPDMGFSLSHKWIDEGPPKLGCWKVTFKSHRRCTDYRYRMSVCETFLGWEFPEDQSFPDDDSALESRSEEESSSNDGDGDENAIEERVDIDAKILSFCPFGKYLKAEGNVDRSVEDVVDLIHEVYAKCSKKHSSISAVLIREQLLATLRDDRDVSSSRSRSSSGSTSTSTSSSSSSDSDSEGSSDAHAPDSVLGVRLTQLLVDMAHYRDQDRRIRVFSKIVGLCEERLFCDTSGELMFSLLSRAFKGDLEKMSVAFKREPAARVPLRDAIAMVIGEEGERHSAASGDGAFGGAVAAAAATKAVRGGTAGRDSEEDEGSSEAEDLSHRATWTCPELRLVANGAQIDSLLGKIEKLKRYDLSIAPKEKRVLLDEVLGLVMEHFFDWYSTALQTLREGWERQKRSEIHFDHFVSIMNDYNEPFLGGQAPVKWMALRTHLGITKEKAGINHPELFAVGAGQLRILPRLPQNGPVDGHQWVFENEEVVNTGDVDADDLRNELMQMLQDGDIVEHAANYNTDSSTNSNDGSEDGFDVDVINDSLLDGAPAVPKRKDDKRRMSFLWGRPLEISEAVQKKAAAKPVPILEPPKEQAKQPANKGGRKRRGGIVSKHAGKKKRGKANQRRASRASGRSRKSSGQGSAGAGKTPTNGADDGDASVQSKSSWSAVEATAIVGLLSAKVREPGGLDMGMLDPGLLGGDESSQPGQW